MGQDPWKESEGHYRTDSNKQGKLGFNLNDKFRKKLYDCGG